MRLFELKNNLKSRPVVYVDMDGVLADFFGAVAQAHGVDHWKNIKNGEVGLHQAAQKEGFFANLPKLPNADRLIGAVTQLAGSYSILSSPLQSDVENSSRGKAVWLKNKLGGAQPQSVVFDHEKYRYAQQPDETPNILIDDYPVNINLWNQHGGIGILYKDSASAEAIEKLKQVLENPLAFLQTPDQKVQQITEGEQKLFTPMDVLDYVKGIHHKYTLDDPIRKIKVWRLINVPTSHCRTPEYLHQDDPYMRRIALDWDHVKKITLKDIMTRPAVVDSNGWVLDGNHRVTAARLHGLDSIPIIVPAV
jgi:5'(3')-deoxyribonucleotidase